MKLKKYQINYISQGKLVSEMVEAVSRKAARKYMNEIGFEHIKKDQKAVLMGSTSGSVNTKINKSE